LLPPLVRLQHPRQRVPQPPVSIRLHSHASPHRRAAQQTPSQPRHPAPRPGVSRPTPTTRFPTTYLQSLTILVGQPALMFCHSRPVGKLLFGEIKKCRQTGEQEQDLACNTKPMTCNTICGEREHVCRVVKLLT